MAPLPSYLQSLKETVQGFIQPSSAPAPSSAKPGHPAKRGAKASASAVHKSYYISLRDPARDKDRPKTRHRKLSHLAVFSKGNAGDHLLPVTLRDLFDEVAGPASWRLRNVRPLFGDDGVKQVNASDGVIIGGGGLFLRDTNENLNSGWQWNCPVKKLAAIRVPMVVFAVGYNRFRGQAEFDPVFRDHLELLAEKSTYIGLRNYGSIRAIKEYLPEKFHPKIRFQPCMTTLVKKLYPQLTERPPASAEKPLVSINMAFDRPELRYGDQEVQILTGIARAMAALSQEARIDLVIQGSDDGHVMPFFRGEKVPFNKVDLRQSSPEEIVRYYSSVDLALGMRGHAQMIPFGCGTPILSLITHDKVRWFLDDIGQPDWGIELKSADLDGQVLEKCRHLLSHRAATMTRILEVQEELWRISAENVTLATNAFDGK